MTQELEHRFNEPMWDIHGRAYKEEGYNASRYLLMLYDHGGLGTAKILINSSNVSEGYTTLWKLRRLDLTVEAQIYDHPEWHPLFSKEELAIIRKRLMEYKYGPALGSA